VDNKNEINNNQLISDTTFNSLQLIRIFSGIFTILIGVIILAGYLLGKYYVFNMGKDYVHMADETALLFILIGIFIIFFKKSRNNRKLHYFIFTLSVFIGLVGILATVDSLTNYTYNLSEILGGNHDLIGNIHIGKMSLITALTFVLYSISLIILIYKNETISTIFSSLNLFVGYVIIIGYWFGVPFLYGGTYIPVALPTAIVIFISSLGLILSAGFDNPPIKYFLGESTQARLMRNFIPIIFIYNLIQDLVVAYGNVNYNSYYALRHSIVDILSLIITTIIIAILSKSIGKSIDENMSERKKAEEEMRKSRDILAKLNDELKISRTAALNMMEDTVEANYELEALNEELANEMIVRQNSEEQLNLFAKILLKLNRQNDWQNLLKDILKEIKSFTGLDAIGIRLKEGDEYPYFFQDGFDDEFIKEENYICSRSKDGSNNWDNNDSSALECICKIVLSGITEKSKHFLTEGGSLWTNNSTDFLTLISNTDPFTNPRNICFHNGYKSVAIIPISSGDEIIGLLQLNHKLTDRFSLDFIEFFEEIGSTIGIAFRRMQSEKRIRKSEENYRSVTQTANDAIISTNNKGIILDWNNGAEKIFGYKVDEILGKKLDFIIPSSYLDLHNIEIQHLTQDGGMNILGNTVELYGLHKNGVEFPIELSLAEWDTSDGKFFSGIIRDISLRKAIEQQILYQVNLLNNVSDAILSTDREFIIRYWNKAADKQYGWNSEEVIGQKFTDYIKPQYINESSRSILIKITKTGLWSGELIHNRRDGTLFPVYVTISEVKDNKGQIIGHIVINRDITELKKAETELIKAKEKAEEMNKLKTNFLANMSHELRTPMIGILGFSQLINNINDIKEVKELGDLIYCSGRRLMDTLNMILDISIIESSREKINFTEVDLADEIQSVINLYRVEADKKNLTISFENIYKKFCLISDSKAINCILNNLIHNAIKFTITGKVTARLLKEEIDSKNWAVIEVIDTGIGIADENINYIFDEFRQISEGTSRSYEGIGLGLTLTKKYVDLLGGNIIVRSNLNIGSVFSVYLPLTSDYKIDLNDHSLKSKVDIISPLHLKSFNTRKNLLIVDDDETTRVYFKMILSNDYDYDFAINGNDALEKAENCSYDAILMDINLGKGISGVEVQQEIRKNSDYITIPIIAITANAMKGDEDFYLNSGFTNYISKPFYKSELLELLNSILNNIF
jgi:PAS domain S-box-containing protein